MNTQTLSLQPAKRSTSGTVRVLASILIAMAIGVLAGWFIGKFMKSHGTSNISGWTLLLLPVALFLVIGLHEAGHVIGGLVCGFQFRLFIAGPLRIERDGNHVRFSFNRIPLLWGGVAACVPQSFGPDVRRKMILFTAGGPLFSFLGATLLPAGLETLQLHPNAAFLLLASGVISAGIGIVTLLPLPASGFKTDGSRLWMLFRRRPEGTRWTALASLSGLLQTARPRDWPTELMTLLGDGLDAESDAVMACLMHHIWHMDRREYEPAEMWLERGLSHIDSLPKSAQPILYLAAAQYYARHGEDKAIARRYFDLSQKPGLHSSKDSHAVRAAVLIAEGRQAEARSELDLAEKALLSKPPSMAQWMREDIAELHALIQ